MGIRFPCSFFRVPWILTDTHGSFSCFSLHSLITERDGGSKHGLNAFWQKCWELLDNPSVSIDMKLLHSSFC